jgi:Zn-finger nucleic acid-binding protein
VNKQLSCPCCGEMMRKIFHNQVELDFCTCGTVWFDENEAALYFMTKKDLPNSAKMIDPFDDTRPKCPKCHVILQEFEYPSQKDDELKIDKCPICNGILLEKGETEKMKRASIQFSNVFRLNNKILFDKSLKK